MRTPDTTTGNDTTISNATTTAQTFYGRWVRLYDVIATFPGVGSWRERAAERLELSPGDTVVEMGCGTGANLPYLRERVGATGTVVGIDFTRGMLDRAATRVARAGWTNVHLVRGDASAPPVGTADAVLSSFVVGMLGEPAKTVGDWLDLLKPGGRIALLDAAQSGQLRARPLDIAFEFFVAASTPPTTQLRYENPPWERLDRRVFAARRPLAERTTHRTHETYALGFVRVSSGRIPMEA